MKDKDRAEEPLSHPLAGHPRDGVGHQLIHYFERAPLLPKLALEPSPSAEADIPLCARLIDAFDRAITFEEECFPPEKRPGAGVWQWVKTTHHGDAYRLLASKDVAGLADYLRNGLRTSLCYGLGSGPSMFEAMSGANQRAPFLLLADRLAAVAEAVGALALENPFQGQYGQTMSLEVSDLVGLIEDKLGFPIDRPPVMGLYGIQTIGGIIDPRVPDDAYCAHRVRSVCEDLSVPSAIEIGGGFGGMALFALRAGAERWSIVDLPVMNVVQGYFLSKCLGDGAVRFFGEENPTAAVEVLPYWDFFDRSRSYALVFNRDSLPEIPRDHVEEYLDEIEARGAVFLSINQESGASAGYGLHQLNIHRIITERGKLVCRARYPYWVRKGYVEELFLPRPPA